MISNPWRNGVMAAACAAIGMITGAAAQSPGYPDKPITLIIPFAAGSGTDQLARALGAAMTDGMGQPVVIDNRPGAGGIIAATAAAHAAPNGYTAMVTTNTTQAANVHLYKKLSYDPVKDFVPVTGLSKGGQFLVVRTDAPYHSVADLIAAARKTPGKLTFGSGSSSSRAAGEMLKQLAGIDLLHIPYKSNPQAVTDLLGGQIDLMITDTATAMPQILGGKLRALGYSSRTRNPLLPDVPTIEEAGVKGYDMGYWVAAYVPAGTPAPVVARLREIMIAADGSTVMKNFLKESGTEPWTTTSDELAQFQASETDRWGKVIKAAGIEPE